MKKTLHIFLFIGLFFASFFLFLFLTFPYEVLKESLSAEVSQATGYNVRIGDMSPNLPLGITAKDIRVDAPNGGATMNLGAFKLDLGVFSLLLGKLHVNAAAESGKGDLEVGLDFGLFDLVKGAMAPRHFSLASNAFPLDGLAAFGLSVAANAPGANPMVAPLLGALGLSAQLTGKAEVALDTSNPTQSTGNVDINFGKMILKLSHPSLGLPDQAFKKSVVKASVQSGTLVLDKASGFISEELELLTDGKITLKPDIAQSLLDMKVVIELKKDLKEKFGFVMDAVTGTSTADGKVTMQVRGSMAAPVVTTL